jgi:hypothetical protein
MEIKSDLVRQRKAQNASSNHCLQKFVAGAKWRITGHFHRYSENVERSILLNQYQLLAISYLISDKKREVLNETNEACA